MCSLPLLHLVLSTAAAFYSLNSMFYLLILFYVLILLFFLCYYPVTELPITAKKKSKICNWGCTVSATYTCKSCKYILGCILNYYTLYSTFTSCFLMPWTWRGEASFLCCWSMNILMRLNSSACSVDLKGSFSLHRKLKFFKQP